MATINDVIVNLSKTITNGTGWRCGPLSDNPNVPCVEVWPDNIGGGESYYDAMKRGVVNLPFVAYVLIGSTALRTDQLKLLEAISPHGPRSIPQSIFNAPTLGTSQTESISDPATSMTAHVVGVDDYGFTDSPAGRLLGAKVRVNVMVRGDI